MTESSNSTVVKLCFSGEGFEDGKVPISILAAKLEALQNLVYHAAATVAHDEAGRRGQWTNRYRSVAELTFAESHHSDLVIEARLPEASQLFADDECNVGKQAVSLLFDLSKILEEDPSGVADLVQDRQDRKFLLRGMESLCPSSGADYAVSLSNGVATRPPARFTGETRERLRKLVLSAETQASPTREIATVVGTLTKIHVEVGPPMVAIQTGAGRELNCFYDDSLRDQIANLLAGSTVEATGLATLTEEGYVQQIDKVLEIEVVDTEPLRLRRLTCDGRVFRFRSPLSVTIERTDDVWIYGAPEISVWAAAERREDALRELAENFAYAWEEFAEEDASVLDEGALEVKNRLQALVEQDDAS